MTKCTIKAGFLGIRNLPKSLIKPQLVLRLATHNKAEPYIEKKLDYVEKRS